MRRLLAHRDARIYLAGQSLSTLGDSALWLAMGIWVKLLTGSSSAAGLVFFAFICGACLGPLTGVITDRVRRRPLLITANLGTGALVCLLLLVGGRSGVWLIYLVMFGYGVSYSLLSSAQSALLPAMVPADLLGAANSALQTLAQGLRLITPLLGAGLLAWLGPVPVIIGRRGQLRRGGRRDRAAPGARARPPGRPLVPRLGRTAPMAGRDGRRAAAYRPARRSAGWPSPSSSGPACSVSSRRCSSPWSVAGCTAARRSSACSPWPRAAAAVLAGLLAARRHGPDRRARAGRRRPAGLRRRAAPSRPPARCRWCWPAPPWWGRASSGSMSGRSR